MIVTGLAIEAVAGALVVLGLLNASSPSASTIWWSSIAVALVGLAIVAVGLRRARPMRGGWTPPAALVDPD